MMSASITRPILYLVVVMLAAASHSVTLGLDAGDGATGADRLLVPVSLTSVDGEAAAGLQFDVNFDPVALQFAGLETGNAAGNAEKIAHANLVSPGQLRVVIAGFNRNAIASGTVAQLEFSWIATGEAVAQLRMNGAVVSDPFGSPLPVGIAPDTLTLDRSAALAIATDTDADDAPVSSYASLARYRAVVFALVVVGIVMLLSRKAPKKGRRH